MSFRSSGKIIISQVRYNPIYRFQGGIGGKSAAKAQAVQALAMSSTVQARKMMMPSLDSTFFMTQVGKQAIVTIQ